MRGVFLDFDTVSRGDVATTALDGSGVAFTYHGATAPDEVVARIGSREVVVTNKLRLGAGEFEAASNLRLVCLVATGTDNVDLEAAAARGIAVCNIERYCTPSVVQHVFALILALNHHLVDYRRRLRDGAWQDSPQFCVLEFPIRELDGRTMGIVGMGELGTGVARLARALGMTVIAARRPGQPPGPDRVALDELLARSDVVSLHCPLTPRTRGLIGARELSLMKPDALLVNTARGALVDSAALAEALRAGRLGGAGIDVLPEEPPVHGDPLLAVDMPNLIVTPHVAWAAREARQRAVDEVAANIASFLAGGRRGRVG
jgi:glycerate dehydrogenase